MNGREFAKGFARYCYSIVRSVGIRGGFAGRHGIGVWLGLCCGGALVIACSSLPIYNAITISETPTRTPAPWQAKGTATRRAIVNATMAARTATASIYKTTPTPIVPIPQPPTPTIMPESDNVVDIRGTAEFERRVNDALRLIYAFDARMARDYLYVIQQASENRAYVAERRVTISDSASITWLAGAIVHEAVHVRNYHTGNVYYGCEGEKRSLSEQARFLHSVGDTESARYVESLIGVWGC